MCSCLLLFVTLRDCQLRDCAASFEGGAVVAEGADVSLQGCQVVNNTALSGAGVYLRSGAAATVEGSRDGCTMMTAYKTPAPPTDIYHISR